MKSWVPLYERAGQYSGRVRPGLLRCDASLARSGGVIGIDEVGRGALAGPVVVGAVGLSAWRDPPVGLDDSKRLSARAREALVEPIFRWADAVSVGESSAQEIDAWGLSWALAVAIDRALTGLASVPGRVIIDGPVNLMSPAPRLGCPELAPTSREVTTMVSADRYCATVAAASVIAKVHRDQLMDNVMGEDAYGFRSNKGYGTAAHLAALRRLGPTPLHRRSWRLPTRADTP